MHIADFEDDDQEPRRPENENQPPEPGKKRRRKSGKRKIRVGPSKTQRRKEERKRKARGGGKLKNIAMQAQKRHAGDPHRQLNFILRSAGIPAAFGRDRTVSDKTSSDLGKLLHRVIPLLKRCGMPIQNLMDIGRKHVVALCRHWEREGLSDKTVNTYVSILRRFLDLTGKFGAVPTGYEWQKILLDNGINAGTRGCSILPTFAKGWRDHGVDPAPIMKAIGQEEPVVECQMEMMEGYGLRPNEVAQIVPADSDKGDHLMIWRGTKGGKERRINFSTIPEKAAEQRRILDKAKQLASHHPKRILAIPGLSLLEMKNRMLYLARKHGVSRDGLGITLHGLRHQFACNLFTELTGLPAPVLKKVAPEVYVRSAAKVQTAMLEIARQMGHERAPIAHAYTGSPAGECKRANSQLKTWSDALAKCKEDFESALVAEAWIVGSCAKGLPVPADGYMTIALRAASAMPEPGASNTMVVEHMLDYQLPLVLACAIEANVKVVPWTDLNPPADGFEINF